MTQYCDLIRDTSVTDKNGYQSARCARCGFEIPKYPANHDLQIPCSGSRRQVVVDGPGTELKKILNGLGLKPKAQCGCDAKVAEMNVLGPDGCRQRRAELIEHLKGAYHTIGWIELLEIGAKVIAEPWFSITDPIGSMLDEAIRRADTSSQLTGTTSSALPPP